MIQTGKTAIIYNNPSKIIGLAPYYYRWRTCDTNLNGNTPADQYQKLKLIQRTVRVPGSLYIANLGPLTAYKKPGVDTYGVCWNQMSDRPAPSVQRATIPTGYATSLNRRHTSVTSSRPGCQTPGGVGCDIKHNSYERYLNRLKGKGPMRRGVVPPNFGAPIPFNVAMPVYGGKTVKTNIIDGCDCPIAPMVEQTQDTRIYSDPLLQAYPNGNPYPTVGEYVYAKEGDSIYFTRAIILSIIDGIYTIQFDDGTIQTATIDQLRYYFPCNCDVENPNNVHSGFYTDFSIINGLACNIPIELLDGTQILYNPSG